MLLIEKPLGHLRSPPGDLAVSGMAKLQVESAAGQADIVVSALRPGLAAGGCRCGTGPVAFLEAIGQSGPVAGGGVATDREPNSSLNSNYS